MIKLAVFSAVLAVVSAGFLPLDYHYAQPLVVHKPVASSYSYFHKVDHSVPIVKTIYPAPIVASPLIYKPLPYYHGLHLDHFDSHHGYHF